MMEKFGTLLIDGDVVAFIASAAVQHTIVDPYGNVRYHGDRAEGEIAVDQMLAKFRRHFGKPGAKQVVILSDRDNWRYQVMADYKNNRDPDGGFGNRPLLLESMKQYLIDNWGATYKPRLEADDTLAIMATDPSMENAIVIGRDKDFKCIPGWHYQIKQKDEEFAPFFLTVPEADAWHLAQSIAGDATDGFFGCPGMGIKRAVEVLEAGIKFVPEEGTLTRGPNKGQRTIKWHKVPAATPWETVVSCYERAGLGEMEALDNARLAHLLRWGEYDNATGEVKLWTPN